jgi:Zn-dependent protease
MSNLSLLFEDPVGFLRSMLLVLPAILIGLSVHEFAHAWVSDRLGDPTPRAQGRLTISPFAKKNILYHFIPIQGGEW